MLDVVGILQIEDLPNHSTHSKVTVYVDHWEVQFYIQSKCQEVLEAYINAIKTNNEIILSQTSLENRARVPEYPTEAEERYKKELLITIAGMINWLINRYWKVCDINYSKIHTFQACNSTIWKWQEAF